MQSVGLKLVEAATLWCVARLAWLNQAETTLAEYKEAINSFKPTERLRLGPVVSWINNDRKPV